MKLSLLIFLSCWVFWTGAVGGATMPIEQIELGKIIEINGQKFVKIGHDPVKGSQFIAWQKTCFPNQFNGKSMQNFTAVDCACLPTPSGANYVLAGTMTDARDGKSYEVRKFSDGKCWMVDNLAYGGATDACVNKTTFSGNGAPLPTNIFGAGTYGDCRNSPGYPGYLYSWQAVMQHSSAYWNVDYNGPATTVQGICPAGWHVPSGDMAGEFRALHLAAGSPVTGFWQPGGNWKGEYTCSCEANGDLVSPGNCGNYWSSTQMVSTHAYALAVNYRRADPAVGEAYNEKGQGLTVRCVKDTTERTMQNFSTADCDSYSTPSGTNYAAIGMLKDERDGKWYEIRKFSDGKCWMVDNLMYGGSTDGSSDYCAGKYVWRNADTAANAVAAATSGLNPTDGSRNILIGDCWDPRAGDGAPCTAGSTTCGYLYNWPATIQNVNGWSGNLFQPTEPTQGICPQGWHIPAGDAAGEYQALHAATGYAMTDFWQVATGWKGVLQGAYGNYWSSTQGTATAVEILALSGNYVYVWERNTKSVGLSIRCIKD